MEGNINFWDNFYSRMEFTSLRHDNVTHREDARTFIRLVGMSAECDCNTTINTDVAVGPRA